MNKAKAIREISKFNSNLLNSECGDRIDLNEKGKSVYKVAIAFPSKYDVAMHTLGFLYLYFEVNRNPKFFASRAYMPSEALLDYHKRFKIPILTQEANIPLNEMDMILFSINYEGNYMNILEMLKLSNIPLLRKDRKEGHPIIIGGGVCPTYNPMPLSPFFDAFVIGEAESVLSKILDTYSRLKDSALKYSKKRFLSEISNIRGIFIPSLPKKKINKSKTYSIDYDPKSIISPYTKYPNQLYLEIARGCNRGCKFCILGAAFLKKRNRDKLVIINHAKRMSKYTNEIRLVCPSDTDHQDIIGIHSALKRLGYKITIGSQRADELLSKKEMLSLISNESITIAPETGEEKLRFKIGKRISDSQIYDCIKLAAKSKASVLHLFLILGFFKDHKKEADDIIGLIKSARTILDQNGGRSIKIEATINCHIKKPQTKYERLPQMRPDAYFKYSGYIRKHLKKLVNLKIILMDERLLYLESVLVCGTEKDGLGMKKLFEKAGTSYPEKIDVKDIKKIVRKGHFLPKKGRLPWSFIDLKP